MQSFLIVGVAEIFDKTWFVALLMSIRHEKYRMAVFLSSFTALALHTLIAAAFGYGVSRFVDIWVLHFSAAALYAVFFVMYAIDWYQADPDADIISAGVEEAEEELTEDAEGNYEKPNKNVEGYGAVIADTRKKKVPTVRKVCLQCFIAMFVAEWGDRTQIAMMGQHASQPLIPVCVGSLLAFGLLTMSAVLAGNLVDGHKLSEKSMHMFSAASFLCFSLLALRDGLNAKPVNELMMNM